jgi:hypothetical protein
MCNNNSSYNFLDLLARTLWASFSDLLSKPEVASSNINIFGLVKIILAIAVRYFRLQIITPFNTNKIIYWTCNLEMNSVTYTSSQEFYIISSTFPNWER